MHWETARCEDNLRIYNNTHGYGSQERNQSKQTEFAAVHRALFRNKKLMLDEIV